MPMPMRIPLFRIWYSTTYTVLFVVLVLLLAVTPGDTIYQSFRTKELQKLFSIGGVYLLTVLVVLLIYSTRLYTNRSVLQAIPKPYLPVEDGEVGRLVRRMIVKQLKRSAIVAWDSRPRDVRSESRDDEDEEGRLAAVERAHKKRGRHQSKATVIPVSAKSPPWGYVSHPGWGPPSDDNLANLQYWQVVAELPNLIEAKAVSLAPPDPALDLEQDPQTHNDTPMLPDAQVVALLQRPWTMGLREYLGRLASFGLLNPPSLGPQFLGQYEYARFSSDLLTEPEFRELMAIFAQVLSGMTQLDPVVVEEARAQISESDSSSLAPSESTSSSSQSGLPYQTPRIAPQFEYSSNEHSSSPQTVHTALSFAHNVSSSAYRTPSERSYGSGSVRIRRVSHSGSAAYTLARMPSGESFGSGSVRIRPVQRSPSTILPNSSSSSSVRSDQSVIRIRPNPGPGESPYQYSTEVG
ncbi:hypothetical protein BDV95DRAFT_583124 [Massariosphaeria phaeospora]|uniref:Defect at low temperature protein 1 n=1 Tax=Massariosphaeria phaeospora TaxID=100035 RepID=A0A7C8M360_9PLEO|nr:hypothetical protein BDV95DRAFT_583124 [Massariosphaeria phaeospora]